jgi:hypothetical protein
MAILTVLVAARPAWRFKVLSVAAAIANVWWVVLVGDSGARAVWESVVLHTRPGG